jgi:hypothetical protein
MIRGDRKALEAAGLGRKNEALCEKSLAKEKELWF